MAPELMKIKVRTILELREILGQRELELFVPEGCSIAELLASMIDTWGDSLGTYLLRPKGEQNLPHVRLMVNGRDIQFLNGEGTVLQNGDEVLLLPIVSGG